ncbi:MAG: heavy metal sensor histidine kinase [Burkholderiaceae bacterium]|jgi:two-component system, OmpR family, heavy metal sensor histidine kinase CusS|nr:heavy metal sensor histidine kinase [Burkholderiaceae bacterium]MDP4968564.1 heavy metal sensor histidine kinase [Burkholderiaceae bacterium]
MLKRLTLISRLTILYALISALVLCGLGVMVARASYLHFVDLDLAYLQGKASLVERGLAQTSEPSAVRALLAQQMDSHEGLYIGRSDGTGPGPVIQGMDFSALNTAVLAPGTSFDWQTGGVTLRGIKVPMQSGGSLLLGLDMHHHAHFMTQLHYTLAIYLFVATILSGLLGWWAARRGLAPLRVMRERARNIDARQLNVRMPIADSSAELVELAQGLNLMLERLEQDFERLSEFSSDLAHELRTPITNLLTQTQVTLTREREVEAYRDILASNAEEFQRLARMVSDMLYLAKTEHGLELPHREQLSLATEVQALFDFYEAVAEEAEVGLTLEGEAMIVGDRLMLRRAIGNLLSNALRHAFKHSVVEVLIRRLPDAVELTVKNAGQPIAESDIPRLFDRFYRTQKSRPHPEHSGTGLGLSITRSLMLAHGGTIKVVSDKKNTSFTLVFPVRP